MGCVGRYVVRDVLEDSSEKEILKVCVKNSFDKIVLMCYSIYRF